MCYISITCVAKALFYRLTIAQGNYVAQCSIVFSYKSETLQIGLFIQKHVIQACGKSEPSCFSCKYTQTAIEGREKKATLCKNEGSLREDVKKWRPEINYSHFRVIFTIKNAMKVFIVRDISSTFRQFPQLHTSAPSIMSNLISFLETSINPTVLHIICMLQNVTYPKSIVTIKRCELDRKWLSLKSIHGLSPSLKINKRASDGNLEAVSFNIIRLYHGLIMCFFP